ncbi:MAG: pyruvate kinase, partial [Micrococcales bacterium]|nr:pyruvate kinase [Micrococcales bacterium]
MRRARIVCTIGPATEGREQVQALVDAGMDVARLNRSHGDDAFHNQAYADVRAAAAASGRSVAVLVDLQGPKIRLGAFGDGPHDLETGHVLTITTDDVVGTRDRVSTTYAGLPGDVSPGDLVLIDDGKVQVRVTAVDATDV